MLAVSIPTEQDSGRSASQKLDAVLCLKHVIKTYGSGPNAVCALQDLSLALHASLLTVIAGPSGSGKSTLLSILGGLMRPTSGSMSVFGRAINKASESELARIRRKHFGYIFQGIHLIPSLTVAENVGLALEIKGLDGPKAHATIQGLLEEVGIPELAHRKPKDMSGGQRQRAAIARALAGGPNILLADEPTAALDQANATSILKLLRRLARRMKTAVVVVTHDQHLFKFGDRLLTLEDGRLTS